MCLDTFSSIPSKDGPIVPKRKGGPCQDYGQSLNKKNKNKKKRQKKVKRENPRKLIMQHLLPTQPAYAPPLSTSSSFSSSSPLVQDSAPSIPPSLPLSPSQLRHPALHCVLASTLLPPLWGGRSKTLHCLASLLHTDGSFWAICYKRLTLT